MIYDIQDKIALEKWAREIEGFVGKLDGRILVLEAQIEQLKNQTANLQKLLSSGKYVSSSHQDQEATVPVTEVPSPPVATG